MSQASSDDIFTVFISFKSDYQLMAEEFRKQLATYGGNSLKVHISTDIPAGKNWRDWIREKIIESDLLILLFTAPKGTWDWCLYEVGLFREPSDMEKRPVVCIHNPKYPTPDPIKDLQSVKADAIELKEFLKKFYGTTEISKWYKTLNESFANDDHEVERVAEHLSTTFIGEPAREVYINKYLMITVKDIKTISENKIPADAEVQSNSRSLEIFGLTAGEWIWGDLEKTVREQGNSEWIEQLEQSIYQASQKKIPQQITGTLNAPSDGRVYRPVLYRVDYGSDHETITFYVLFILEGR